MGEHTNPHFIICKLQLSNVNTLLCVATKSLRCLKKVAQDTGAKTMWDAQWQQICS